MCDKMREDFERWWDSFLDTKQTVLKHAAWGVWKASRESLCVKLPETYEIVDLDGDTGNSEPVMNPHEVKDALTDAGVKYK